MKFKTALEIMKSGFMVSFEKIDGFFLISDHFPDFHAGEELIKTEEEAWKMAKKFAAQTKGKYINIYVIDHNFSPVVGYEKQLISNRLNYLKCEE